jgi:predicted XRE-type DNA-binding protein
MLMAGVRRGGTVQAVINNNRRRIRESPNIFRVTQPRASDLLRGQIDLFSTDALIDTLARLGVRVHLVIKSSRRGLKVA